MLNAIDISLFTGEITQAQVQQMTAQGLQHVVIGYDTTDLSTHQRQAVIGAGCSWDAYRFIYPNRDLNSQIDNVLQAITAAKDGPPPGYLWLDIEDDSGYASDFWKQTIQTVVQLARQGPTPVGIYTGAWWWNKYLLNWTWPADNGVKLWTADWDGVLDVNRVHLYGGWSEAEGKQYVGNLATVIPACDGDVFRERGTKPPVPDLHTIEDRLTKLETDMSIIGKAWAQL